MKQIKRKKLSVALVRALGAGMAVSVIVTAAHAQQAQRVEKIEVTGSNIKRIDTETPAPVQIITRQDIERSGKQTIADVIRELPADNNGSIPLSFGSGFAAGASGISLRGLTANSTLVLINGRRTAPYGLADDGQRNFVNINTIPLEAVERIEVLKDGASAIYGSDAIAGVVNVILRSDFQGASIAGSWGQTRYNDGENWRVSATAGKGDLSRDRYNVFVNVEANKQDAIFQRDREGRDWIGDPDVRRWGYSLTAGTTLAHLAGYIRPATGATLAISANPFGAVRNPANLQYVQLSCNNRYELPAGLGGCLWAPSDYAMIIPEQESMSVMARGTFQVTNLLTAYAEGGLYQDQVKTQTTPASVSSAWPDVANNTIRNNATIALGANHPDNPFPGTAARFRYATADVGPRRGEYENTVTRFVAGLKGTAWNWDFDTGIFYAESKTDAERKGFIRDSVLRSLLDGTNSLGYYRLGANAHLNSPEMYAALSPTLAYSSKTSVQSLDFKATREIMQLPGGPMGLALGAETRKEELSSPPVPFTDVADIVGLGFASFDQSRRVNAIYGEISAPILKGVELAAAVRTDDYSDYGRSTTPKVGIRWAPSQQVLLRATYAEGFRAPGAAESGNSSSAGFTSYHDPVRCAVPDATGCEGTAVVITTGNPLVRPEESKSFTAGFVFEPFRNASISIDYWQIHRTNEITGADLNLVIANPAGYPTAQIIRDTNDLPGIPNSGTVLAVGAPYVNVSKTETNGFDVDAQYRFAPGPLGRFSAGFVWTYIRSFKKFQPDGTVTDYVGTHGPTALSSNAGTPRNRGSLTLTWENGPVTLSTTTAYVSGVKNVEYNGDPNGCLNAFASGDDAPDNCRVGSFTTTSLFGKFRLSPKFEIFGSIQNLFDKVAPLDIQTYGANRYNPTFHLAGAIGIQYSVGARYTFK